MDPEVMMNKLVKQYDLNALVMKLSKDAPTPLKVYGSWGKVVVLTGPKGCIVTDRDAVHYCLKSEHDTVEIDCGPIPKNPNTILLCPTHTVDLPVVQIQKQAPCTEVRLGDFVRRFGSRLEGNYCVLLDSIKKIGLDPAEYPRDQTAAA